MTIPTYLSAPLTNHAVASAVCAAHYTTITIHCATVVDDGVVCPAESVTILGIDSIIRLREFCNNIVKKHEELHPAPPTNNRGQPL